MQGSIFCKWGALTPPTGGSVSRLYLGVSPTGFSDFDGYIQTLKITHSCLSDAEMLASALRLKLPR